MNKGKAKGHCKSGLLLFGGIGQDVTGALFSRGPHQSHRRFEIEQRLECASGFGSFSVDVEELLCLLQLIGVFDLFTSGYASQCLSGELVPDGSAILVVSVFDSHGNDLVNQHVEFQSAISAHM